MKNHLPQAMSGVDDYDWRLGDFKSSQRWQNQMNKLRRSSRPDALLKSYGLPTWEELTKDDDSDEDDEDDDSDDEDDSGDGGNSHYNPDEPRIPAGQPGGGQWTTAGNGTSTDSGSLSVDDIRQALVDRFNNPAPQAQGVQVAADDGVQNDAAPPSWGNPDTLGDHFNRHAADFGIDPSTPNAQQNYANQANDFFQRSFDEGLPIKIDQDGYLRIYDPNTNIFGAYNPDGTTRTYFSPPEGQSYFDRQPGTLYIGGKPADTASPGSVSEPSAPPPLQSTPASPPIASEPELGGGRNGGRMLPEMQHPGSFLSHEFPTGEDEPKL